MTVRIKKVWYRKCVNNNCHSAYQRLTLAKKCPHCGFSTVPTTNLHHVEEIEED